MQKTLFIFDFDGTIVDSFEATINIINNYAKKYDYKKIRQDEISQLKKKNLRQILKHLKISLFRLPVVVKKIRGDLNQEVKELKPSKDYSKVLPEMKRKNCVLGILTSNSKENVMQFLKKKQTRTI